MTEWLSMLSHGEAVEWRRAFISLLVAFGLTQGIAGVYMLTFRGLSYSRTVVQSMALGSIITCTLMLAVGNNIAAGIGIAGGVTAIRFRTTMRDPRDVVFVFASLAIGMASGAQAYGAAIAGATMFAGATLMLHVTGYGSRRQPDGLLRFVAPAGQPGAELAGAIAGVLREHCGSFSLVTLREAAQGTVMEHAYQISVRHPELRARLVTSLQALPGVEDVSLMLQEPTLDL
ncbi:hypothetical protein BE20_52500 [Sorangium cellulosum]|uniref:DUF4956 domain-containing protein n=1 Tax=Sorangium cellulosum TaxID=56 RepID=A0A150S300_SORCE|nr:hypothetical protein BE18_31170 [Sorangium cellulosum]KYG01690.1 hypothetical protein BE20_52500 [Sorangium cellulosum]